MKRSLISLAIAAAFAAPAFGGTFVNGGFEDGNLGSWTGGGGCWGSNNCSSNVYAPYTGAALPLNPAVFNTGTANNVLMDNTINPTDPITGLPTTYGGRYAARVNDNDNDYSVSTIRQSVTNYTDDFIYFAWMAVLESSHGLNDSDYFALVLRDDTAGVNVVSRAYSSAGSIGGGAGALTWTAYSAPAPIYNTWYSAGWVTEAVDLRTAGAGGTSIVGHDFTLTLLASDCPYGGHAGYAYLDGFGAKPPVVPEPGTLALLGIGVASLVGMRKRKPA